MNPNSIKNSKVKLLETHPKFNEFSVDHEVKTLKYIEVEYSLLTNNNIVSMPNLGEQINNVTKATSRVINQVISGQPVKVNMNKFIERLNICNTCEHLNNFRCSYCGCQLIAKTMLETEKCPKDKW